MKTVTLYLVLAILLFIVLFVLFGEAIDRNEIVQCNKLIEQSENFSNFYVTDWQKEMCERHNIYLNN